MVSVSVYITLLHHKGLIKEGEVRKMVNSKTGSVFHGKVVKQVKLKDDKGAVITEVSGKAYYTSESTFYCEQDDPQPSFLSVNDFSSTVKSRHAV